MSSPCTPHLGMGNLTRNRRSPTISKVVCLPILVGVLAVFSRAIAMDELSALPTIDARGVAGAVVVAGGGDLPPQILDRFVELAGGEQARIVVVPTASIRADTDTAEQILSAWERFKVAAISVVHTRSRDVAESEEFIAPLRAATGIWFSGGQQTRLRDVYLGTRFETELYQVLQRGGVVGGTSAGSAIQSRAMIAGGKNTAVLSTGFDLLPGSVVDQHFNRRNRVSRLLDALSRSPGRVGFGVSEGTALIVRGRDLEVIGNAEVAVYFPATNSHSMLHRTLPAGQRADLVALRRTARDRHRARPGLTPERARDTELAVGSLVIVGGDMTDDIGRKFVELANGRDKPIVVLPTALSDPMADVEEAQLFRRLGAADVHVLPQRERDEIESDQFLQRIESAGGVWFSGGRQWRYLDAYEGTKAQTAFASVLQRGGAIGGASAGASIQGDYLIGGTAHDQDEFMEFGYQRGFGFLPGTAIDQHFSQRKRFGDFQPLLAVNPRLLGIGIEEQTAIVVRENVAEVIGENRVYFYSDRGHEAHRAEPYDVVAPGQSYEMSVRRVVNRQPAAGTEAEAAP